MKKTEPGKTWTGLPAATQRALQKGAMLGRAPLPLDLVTVAEHDLAPAIEGGFVKIQEHDLWGEAIAFHSVLYELLAGSQVPSTAEKDIRDLVGQVCESFTRYFVWPPTEMLQNSVEMEPHVEAAARLARGLRMFDELARMQHHRALLLGWRTQKFEKPLEYAEEAAAAFRKTDPSKPHPGTLALILTGLATWQQFTKRLKDARKTLEEAEELLIPSVGKKTIEPFLLYCQIGTVCARMDDLKGMKKAQDEARAILKSMQAPNLEKHIQQTLSWAQWHLQHYIGL